MLFAGTVRGAYGCVRRRVVLKRCVVCRVAFAPRNSSAICCSRTCAKRRTQYRDRGYRHKKYWAKKNNSFCRHCANEFTSSRKLPIFCSAVCRAEYQTARMKLHSRRYYLENRDEVNDKVTFRRIKSRDKYRQACALRNKKRHAEKQFAKKVLQVLAGGKTYRRSEQERNRKRKERQKRMENPEYATMFKIKQKELKIRHRKKYAETARRGYRRDCAQLKMFQQLETNGAGALL